MKLALIVFLSFSFALGLQASAELNLRDLIAEKENLGQQLVVLNQRWDEEDDCLDEVEKKCNKVDNEYSNEQKRMVLSLKVHETEREVENLKKEIYRVKQLIAETITSTSFALNLQAGNFMQHKSILKELLEAEKLVQEENIRQVSMAIIHHQRPPFMLDLFKEAQILNCLRDCEKDAQRKVDLLEQQLQSIAVQAPVSA